MSSPRANRFERRPRTTLVAALILALLAVEAALRLFADSTWSFVHQARQVHAYSDRWYVDLRPHETARLRLDDAQGDPFLDFVLTAGADGFRAAERDAPLARGPGEPCTRYVHAVGDSYTMGWGVEDASSYPSVLETLLPPGECVLNLGVDGYGTLAATEKSMDLAARFPPTHAVYLFAPNDPDDDARALRTRGRPRVAHWLMRAVDVLRRHSYLANAPSVMAIRRRFGDVRRSAPAPRPLPHPAVCHPEQWRLPPAAAGAGLDSVDRSAGALARYRDVLRAKGTALTVFVLSAQPVSLAFHRRCRERGIDATLVDAPPEMTIAGDGHFNAAGNACFARLVREALPGGGAGGPR